MGMANGFHGSAAGFNSQSLLALSFGKNRLYLVGRSGAPLWMRKHGLWQKAVTICWRRLEGVPGHWWVGQNGRNLVILGQGARPPLILKKGTPWRALIPAGYQSMAVQLPDDADYQVALLSSPRLG